MTTSPTAVCVLPQPRATTCTLHSYTRPQHLSLQTYNTNPNTPLVHTTSCKPHAYGGLEVCYLGSVNVVCPTVPDGIFADSSVGAARTPLGDVYANTAHREYMGPHTTRKCMGFGSMLPGQRHPHGTCEHSLGICVHSRRPFQHEHPATPRPGWLRSINTRSVYLR